MYLRNRVIGFFIYGKSWWPRISASSLLKRPSKLQKDSRISSSKRNIRYWLNSKNFFRKISKQQINYYPKFGIDKNYNKNYKSTLPESHWSGVTKIFMRGRFIWWKYTNIQYIRWLWFWFWWNTHNRSKWYQVSFQILFVLCSSCWSTYTQRWFKIRRRLYKAY